MSTEMTREDLQRKYCIYQILIVEKLDGEQYPTKTGKVKLWEYVTDAKKVSKKVIELWDNEETAEYIIINGASYIFLYDKWRRFLLTTTEDYSFLDKALTEALSKQEGQENG